MSKTQLSAVIITLNEAPRIARCIKSLEICDEVVVVDSGSTDGTQKICEDLGAVVIEQDWLGYGAQKQFAVDQASHDWVICLDADEALSDQLIKSVQAFMLNPIGSGCRMPRCNSFMGRWLKHGEGYPDKSLRLFNRQQGQWSQDPVHEKVQCDGEITDLKGDLLHWSQETLSQYIEKQNRYTNIQAEMIAGSSKSIKIAKIILSPFVRFLKFYFVRQGFRDGIPGLIHISIGCFNSFIKYAKARELRG